MAHPRVAPSPVGSGISFRRLPAPTLESLVRACQHYEEKTAGMYGDKSLAARHLYDLSREVQDTVRVLQGGSAASATRLGELEGVLHEWNAVFEKPSPELRAAGVTREGCSPAALARLLVGNAARADAAEAAALAQRVALEREVADLRAALRDSGRVGREQAAHELGVLRGEAEAAVSQERAARSAAVEEAARLRSAFADALRDAVARGVDEQTRALQEEVAAVRADAATHSASASAARDEAEARAVRAESSAARSDAAAVSANTSARTAAQALLDAAAAAAERLEREQAAHAAAAEKLDATWRDKWLANNDTWERATSTARMRGLEAQVTFLSGRTRELQELCDALQGALVNAGAGAAAAAGRGMGGGGAGPPGGASEDAPRQPQPRALEGLRRRSSGGVPWAGVAMAKAAHVRHAAADSVAHAAAARPGPQPALATSYFVTR